MTNTPIDKIYPSTTDIVAIFQYAIMLYNVFSSSLWAYNFISAGFRSNLKTLRSFELTMRLLKILKAHNMLTYNEYLRKEIGDQLFYQYVRDDDTDNLKDDLQPHQQSF